MPKNKWTTVGGNLLTNLPKEMFVYQKYQKDNFLNAICPRVERFFGVKAFNIFIVQYPYGWVKAEDDKYDWAWPPAGHEDSLSLLRSTLDYFASYRTLFYIDMYSAQQHRIENPTSDIVQMLVATAAKINEMCSANSDIFTFKGSIITEVNYTYFMPEIQEFYGSPAYKR